jgi:general stress protein CsbA
MSAKKWSKNRREFVIIIAAMLVLASAYLLNEFTNENWWSITLMVILSITGLVLIAMLLITASKGE